MPNFGKIIGQLQSAVVDGSDPDETPDLVPLTGTITFTPNTVKIVETDAVPNPYIIGSVPIVAILDAEGYISTPDANGAAAYRGIWLIATDDPSLNPTAFQYQVSYSLTLGNMPIPIASHLIAVPGGDTVELALVIPPDAAPPIGTAAAEAAAASAAVSAASAAQDADDAAAAAAVSVKTVNGIVPDGTGNVTIPASAASPMQLIPVVGGDFSSSFWFSLTTAGLRDRNSAPMPLLLSQTISIDQVKFNVTTLATTSGQTAQVRLKKFENGVWSDIQTLATGIPLTDATGEHSVTFAPVQLQAGVIYGFALVEEQAFDTAVRVTSGGLVGPAIGSSSGYSAGLQLPRGANAAVVANNGVPVIRLRRSA